MAGKVAAAMAPTVLAGLSVFGVPVFLAALVLEAAGWVIGSGDRTERVIRVLLAWRANIGCLAWDGVVPLPTPAACWYIGFP